MLDPLINLNDIPGRAPSTSPASWAHGHSFCNPHLIDHGTVRSTPRNSFEPLTVSYAIGIGESGILKRAKPTWNAKYGSPSISASDGDGVAVEGWIISCVVSIGSSLMPPLRLSVPGLLIRTQAIRTIEEKYPGTAGLFDERSVYDAGAFRLYERAMRVNTTTSSQASPELILYPYRSSVKMRSSLLFGVSHKGQSLPFVRRAGSVRLLKASLPVAHDYVLDH
ncbi:hypothetical protein F5883DRAFT_514268 [Diaporthe sp. PMI_573]|nr:hypothetical protein F5883DRAFT_514268 [Diaporthaceae sp. PMI_573]